MQNRMTLRLFDPGMTHMHRVGLAGLYMTMKQLNPDDYKDAGGWSLHDKGIDFFWHAKPKQLFEPIITEAFGISPEGIIDFLVHRNMGLGDLERVQMHNAIMRSFLQHGRTRKTARTSSRLTYDFGGKTIQTEIAPLLSYQNQATDQLFNKKGDVVKDVKLASWSFPGAGVRHIDYSSQSTLTNPLNKFLCLMFAPVASLYYLISCKTTDGKFDNRKSVAIVIPHIKNLDTYESCYQNYLHSPVENLYANSLGDAGLSALVALNIHLGILRELEIDSCSVITLGTIPWSKQQKTRTAIEEIREIDKARMRFFHSVQQTLKHKIIVKKDNSYYARTSTTRGLIAENIAAGRPWFQDFTKEMQSKSLAQETTNDRRGLNAMIQDTETRWPDEADKLFVDAIHVALRNRYGALAARATAKGESIPFDREFERLRTSLMRSKNAQNMRAEIADLFARGGINKELQQNWPTLLAHFTGPDWQKTRDLSLLALASYAGKGAEQMTTPENSTADDNDNNSKEEKE